MVRLAPSVTCVLATKVLRSFTTETRWQQLSPAASFPPPSLFNRLALHLRTWTSGRLTTKYLNFNCKANISTTKWRLQVKFTTLSLLFNECTYLSVSVPVTLRSCSPLFNITIISLIWPPKNFLQMNRCWHPRELPVLWSGWSWWKFAECLHSSSIRNTARVWVQRLLASLLCCPCTTQRSSIRLPMDNSIKEQSLFNLSVFMYLIYLYLHKRAFKIYTKMKKRAKIRKALLKNK